MRVCCDFLQSGAKRALMRIFQCRDSDIASENLRGSVGGLYGRPWDGGDGIPTRCGKWLGLEGLARILRLAEALACNLLGVSAEATLPRARRAVPPVQVYETPNCKLPPEPMGRWGRWWAVVVMASLWGMGVATADINALTNVGLAWDPSPDTNVGGYVIFWGTASRAYTFSNSISGQLTNVVVPELLRTQTYYFAVASRGADGTLSELSNEVSNRPPVLPPATISNTATAATAPSVSKGGTGGGTGGGSASAGAVISQRYVLGIPPRLFFQRATQGLEMTILGTTGAWVTVEANTNLTSLASWHSVTNLLLSETARFATNPPLDVVEKAFKISLEKVTLQPGEPEVEFFRTAMPYDYTVLAADVLQTNGYTPRMVLVRMPGDSEDVCVVPEESAVIHVDGRSYLVRLVSSGSAIREVATSLAASLSLDWTSASEFTYSNGVMSLQATVVKTDSPSSDPTSPGASPIVIDF